MNIAIGLSALFTILNSGLLILQSTLMRRQLQIASSAAAAQAQLGCTEGDEALIVRRASDGRFVSRAAE